MNKLELCNLALARLGQAPISSLDQEDEKTRRINLFYEPVRDEVLCAHNWAFAGVCEPLALLAKESDAEGSFIYKYPAEALFIRRIFLPQAPQQALPFKERFCSDFHCRTLRIAVRPAHAEYTRRITDENLFDAAFIKSFSLALAGDLAIALLGNPELAFRLIQDYTLSLGEAIKAWNRREE